MFIGILSNRDLDEIDSDYLRVHLMDHADLMKRIVTLDETTLSLELVKTYIQTCEQFKLNFQDMQSPLYEFKPIYQWCRFFSELAEKKIS